MTIGSNGERSDTQKGKADISYQNCLNLKVLSDTFWEKLETSKIIKSKYLGTGSDGQKNDV